MSKILLVDDDPDIVAVLKTKLKTKHYNVIVANDGEEGLEMTRAEHPQLILLDVEMPGRSGFDILRALRNDDTTRHIPVVMLTSKRESRSIFKAQDLGAIDYLMKPVSDADLFAVVKKYA